MQRKQNLRVPTEKCSGGLPAALRILRACSRLYLQKIDLNAACFVLIVYKVESVSDGDYSFSQLRAEQKQVGLTPSLPRPGEIRRLRREISSAWALRDWQVNKLNFCSNLVGWSSPGHCVILHSGCVLVHVCVVQHHGVVLSAVGAELHPPTEGFVMFPLEQWRRSLEGHLLVGKVDTLMSSRQRQLSWSSTHCVGNVLPVCLELWGYKGWPQTLL